MCNNIKILITGGSGFIGSYLINKLLELDYDNLLFCDIKEPQIPSHVPYFRNVSILDFHNLANLFLDFKPNIVIHLAALTDTSPSFSFNDYNVNTVGTLNLLNCCEQTNSITQLIVTSTQFVNQYNGIPKNEFDFAPHTVYGISKIISEFLVHSKKFDFCWTIIRPTNIWGPRHPRYPKEFWSVLQKGLYIHPGRNKVIRSYGYVGNVVDQIFKLMSVNTDLINRKVFYVGDYPINLLDWVNEFSLKLNKKKVLIVPRSVVYLLAKMGDLFNLFNLKFPINSSRYKSMTNSNFVDMAPTFAILGQPKYSLEEGVDETIDWLLSNKS
jgi:nucleoside-diphosphate-sugar epimerase